MKVNSDMLNIRTFGGFHISYGEQGPLVIGRNTKMWNLLKCLLAYYPKSVTINKLVEAVCSDDNAYDSANNIKAIVYRLRKTLSLHGGKQDYILFTNGNYLWKHDANCFVDFVEFSNLLRAAEAPGKSDDERISSYNAVISLYSGDFLGEKWSNGETWASNFVVFYRRLFLQAVDSLGHLYERQLDYDSVILLYNKAILIEPYEESLYTRQIQVLIKNGKYAMAKRQYRQIEKFFLKEFETTPSKTLQDLYEEAIKADTRKPTALNRIKKQFDESAMHGGPLLCAPDTFSHIYRYGKRTDELVELPVFLGKITLLSNGEKSFSRDEIELAMKALQSILIGMLRKGDIVCRYSPNQILLMLTTNSLHIQEGIRRIDTLLESEPEWNHFLLETELVQIRDA